MNELFKVARHDGPSPEARAAMWTGIETAASVSVGAASGGSAFAAAKAALVSSKLVLGLVLGASLTMGVVATLITLDVTRAPAPAIRLVAAPRTLEPETVPAVKSETPVVAGHVVAVTAPTEPVIELAPTTKASTTTTKESAVAQRTGSTTLSEQDRLAREARMVSEARGALHRGEPDVALRIVRAARATAGARMVPEELTVEAQALRASGDEEGAKRVEATIASSYPDPSLR